MRNNPVRDVAEWIAFALIVLGVWIFIPVNG